MTARPSRVRQLPAIAVLAVALVGLLAAVLVDWQGGSVVVGLALLLGAGLRLSLPPHAAGWLAIRARGLDAALLLVVGFAVVALALTIPEP